MRLTSAPKAVRITFEWYFMDFREGSFASGPTTYYPKQFGAECHLFELQASVASSAGWEQ